MDSLLDCGVCLQRHDEDKRRPLVLPCGHTLCTACIAKSLTVAEDNLMCPFCRKSFNLMNNTDTTFPDNYTILQMLTLKGTVETSDSNIKESQKEHGQKDDISKLKQNGLQNITSNLSVIRKHLKNLEEYKKQLETQKAAQSEIILKFEEEFKSHKQKLEQLEELISTELITVKDNLAEGSDFIQGLEATKDRLEAAVSSRGVKTAAKDAQRSFVEYQEWKEAMAENPKGLDESKTIIERTSQCLNTLCKPLDLEKHESRIAVYIPSVGISSYITIESLSGMVRKSISGVWTSLKLRDQVYSAQITMTQGCLLLRSLSKRAPPPNTLIIPYQKAKNLVNRSKVTIFLEINAKPTFCERLIHIELSSNEGRTQQFELMCTGEVDGISYAKTTLLDREGPPLPGIWGGARNDGCDTALPGFVTGNKIKEAVVPGLVAGYYYKTPKRNPTNFKIYTAGNSLCSEDCPIGKVVYGLGDIQTLPLGCIDIADCGIVLAGKQK